MGEPIDWPGADTRSTNPQAGPSTQRDGRGWVRSLGTGLLFGLIGLCLNLIPIELQPGVHLLLGPLPVALGAVLGGPLGGFVAGALSGLPTYALWGQAWSILWMALEGLAVGWLSRRMLPVLADIAWWIAGVPLAFVSHVLISGIAPSQFVVILIKLVLNATMLVLVAQGLLLLPAVRRRVMQQLPPSLRDASMGAAVATALALCAGLPLLALGVQEAQARYARELQRLAQHNLADAEIAALGVVESVGSSMRALSVLADATAERWAKEPPDLPALERRLASVLQRSPELLNVHVGNGEGRVLDWAPRAQRRAAQMAERDFAEHPEVRQALATGETVVTGFFEDRLESARPIVVVVVPIVPAGRAPAGFVSAALAFDVVLERGASQMHANQSLRLIDDAGANLVRVGPGHYELTPPENDTLRAAIATAAASDGTGQWTSTASPLKTVNASNTWQIGAKAIPQLGWIVAVLQPRADMRESVWRTYLVLLGSIGLGVLLALGIAVAFRPVLVQPVRAISRAATRLASGRRDTRAGPATALAPLEIRELGEAFDRMAVELSRQLEAEEATSRAKDEFLTIASHELKTPLTALKTHLQLLRRRVPEAAERMEKLDRQVDRLTRLVNQLLDASRAGLAEMHLEPSRCDLAEIARRVAVGLVGQSPKHELRISLEPAVGFWDELRLEQVAWNLVSNALKYSPGGGLIEVEVAQCPDGGASLRVSDRGIGPGEGTEALFDRFTRGVEGTNVSGLGVGLYVARDVVRRHGGTIGLSRREGGGAVATVTLPPAAPREQPGDHDHPPHA